MSLEPIYMYAANADLLAKLVAKQARFVIVGSTATKFHLPQREADDLDLLIDPTRANAEAVIDAVNAGGLQHFQIDAACLARSNVRWSIKAYYYADIITPKDSAEFGEAWADSIEVLVAHPTLPPPVRIAGRSTLISMLNASNELKHKEDVKLLAATSDLQKQKT